MKVHGCTLIVDTNNYNRPSLARSCETKAINNQINKSCIIWLWSMHILNEIHPPSYHNPIPTPNPTHTTHEFIGHYPPILDAPLSQRGYFLWKIVYIPKISFFTQKAPRYPQIRKNVCLKIGFQNGLFYEKMSKSQKWNHKNPFSLFCSFVKSFIKWYDPTR